MYWFAQFRGYPVIAIASSKSSVLKQLVEFIRETKGNLVYSEDEIKKEAEVIHCLDLIDDNNQFKRLFNITNELLAFKEDVNYKLRVFKVNIDRDIEEKIQEVERVNDLLRTIWKQFEDYEEDY